MTQIANKLDKDVVRFCKQFNCACWRLKHAGVHINHTDASLYPIGLEPANRRFMTHWQMYKLPNVNGIHPIALLLHGRRVTNHIARLDLDKYYNMKSGSHGFAQGFMNMLAWRDCWEGYRQPQHIDKFYNSLYFNLGRAFLSKFVGALLPYTLPPAYAKMFAQLK